MTVGYARYQYACLKYTGDGVNVNLVVALTVGLAVPTLLIIGAVVTIIVFQRLKSNSKSRKDSKRCEQEDNSQKETSIHGDVLYDVTRPDYLEQENDDESNQAANNTRSRGGSSRAGEIDVGESRRGQDDALSYPLRLLRSGQPRCDRVVQTGFRDTLYDPISLTEMSRDRAALDSEDGYVAASGMAPEPLRCGPDFRAYDDPNGSAAAGGNRNRDFYDYLKPLDTDWMYLKVGVGGGYEEGSYDTSGRGVEGRMYEDYEEQRRRTRPYEEHPNFLQRSKIGDASRPQSTEYEYYNAIKFSAK